MVCQLARLVGRLVGLLGDWLFGCCLVEWLVDAGQEGGLVAARLAGWLEKTALRKHRDA